MNLNKMFGAVLTTSLPNNILVTDTSSQLPNLTSLGNLPIVNLQNCILGVLVPLNGKVSYLGENKNLLPNISSGTILPYESGVIAEL